ncbi:PssE/Cps14G family polysaccharide biosynthesis glycosyltransferase [Cobetia marina]|uniref:PssE/Cps14G family polysaccharide biosynthesis glycosyltransferase n=1 Tax=Cobetia marina TaxID=28258 RepID=UPI0025467583|nr:PssE/Cps14G family polysaccharide biosynthesis glycosyltransferase [Cobetia pacifica]MDI6004321.1 PssE/Cps14G family polysaccharide biosynthesis glycosyltransferase [Cobetia pacifica]
MKILVTVGTTAFDSLVLNVDKYCYKYRNDELIFQTCNELSTLSGVSFTFSKEIEAYYTSSDLVITHGGAGSIYKLLELNKKIIVCPNFDRIDHHQAEICKYVERNNFALVAWDPTTIGKLIDKSEYFIPSIYIKESFFKFKEISNIIC